MSNKPNKGSEDFAKFLAAKFGIKVPEGVQVEVHAMKMPGCGTPDCPCKSEEGKKANSTNKAETLDALQKITELFQQLRTGTGLDKAEATESTESATEEAVQDDSNSMRQIFLPNASHIHPMAAQFSAKEAVLIFDIAERLAEEEAEKNAANGIDQDDLSSEELSFHLLNTMFHAVDTIRRAQGHVTIKSDPNTESE